MSGRRDLDPITLSRIIGVTFVNLNEIRSDFFLRVSRMFRQLILLILPFGKFFFESENFQRAK